MSVLFGPAPAYHQSSAPLLWVARSGPIAPISAETDRSSMPFYPERSDGSPSGKTQVLDDTLTLLVDKLSPRFQQAADTVYLLGQLEAGWDSYGSDPIQEASITSALRILCAFDLYGLPIPHILPVSGGALQLEWVADNRVLEIAAHGNGANEFLAVEGGNYDSAREGTIDLQDLPTFHELARWLTEELSIAEKR
ncbi:MAG TPA: hypothetical protein VFU48_00600 [Nitrospira sp.]|nr:hypothetical protein [Nitrospira sp.]